MNNKELNEALLEFKDASVEIINSLQSESYDLLDALFIKRQQIIDKIDSMSYTMEEFIEFFNIIQLAEFQKKIETLINLKKNSIRVEIDRMNKSRTANKTYHKNFSVDSIFFNKKI